MAGTLVSSTNKPDGHDMAEILLKVALNTITVTFNPYENILYYFMSKLVLIQMGEQLLNCASKIS